MGDVLKYRIPGKEKIQKSGVFRRLDTINGFEGFVLCPLVHSAFYGFIESSIDAQQHLFSFNKDVPKCYTKEKYIDLANCYLEQFKNDRALKAIFSRIKKIERKIKPEQLFDTLCESYPDAFIYLVSSPFFGTWIGATPETLLHFENEIGNTISLAGTRESNSGIEWTDKEREEQKYVTDFILETLVNLNIESIKMDGPKTVNVGPVEHLKTDFEFKLNSLQQVELIERIHPTPAVCGLPRNEALEIIEEIEEHQRDLYTGFIGEFGLESNLYVNLRCAQIFENECYLYVGGGLTINSIPENEWVETENKAKTLLNIIEKL